jgi:hypothetical protein
MEGRKRRGGGKEEEDRAEEGNKERKLCSCSFLYI